MIAAFAMTRSAITDIAMMRFYFIWLTYAASAMP
jgi:hypothetical protein